MKEERRRDFLKEKKDFLKKFNKRRKKKREVYMKEGEKEKFREGEF